MKPSPRSVLSKIIPPLMVSAAIFVFFYYGGDAYQGFGLAAVDTTRKVLKYVLGVAAFLYSLTQASVAGIHKGGDELGRLMGAAGFHSVFLGIENTDAATLKSMKKGDITQPLRGQKGYQILKIEEATAPTTRAFEEAREDISNRVFTTKRTDEFEKYLKKLRAQSIIEWKNAEVKKAYDLGLTQPRIAPES